MAGGAAVLAALGAIAELELPLSVLGVLPACENMIGAGRRPPVGRDHDRRRPHRRGDEPGRRGPADPRRRALVRARAGRDARHRPRDADRRDARRDGRPLRRRLRQRRRTGSDAIVDAGNDSRRPRLAVAAAPALPPAARVAGRRPAQHLGAAVRVSDHRRDLPRALRRRGTVGARRHARARRCSTTTAATRSARGRAATACACSSSSPSRLAATLRQGAQDDALQAFRRGRPTSSPVGELVRPRRLAGGDDGAVVRREAADGIGGRGVAGEAQRLAAAAAPVLLLAPERARAARLLHPVRAAEARRTRPTRARSSRASRRARSGTRGRGSSRPRGRGAPRRSAR